MMKRLLAVLRRTLAPLPILGDWAWIVGVVVIVLGAASYGASVTVAGVDRVASTSWGIALLLGLLMLLLAVAQYRSQEELDRRTATTAKLEFGRPIPSAEVIFGTGPQAHSETVSAFRPTEEIQTPVLLWRVELVNTAIGTKAANVRARLEESVPGLEVLPINLHEKHDDPAPYAQLRDIRYGEPATFDIVANASRDSLFFWRSDLSDGYVYRLSDSEMSIIGKKLKTEGITIRLKAIADPPVSVAEQEYHLVVDGTGSLNMTLV